jgi:hypothetical protein
MSETSSRNSARAQQGAFSVLLRACSAITLPQCTHRAVQLLAVMVAFVVAAACNRVEAPPPAAPYSPKYVFQSANPAPQKQGVAIAIINPVLKGMVAGGDGLDMLKALPSALTDLITAKGMTYRGPFEQLDTMTFPDKKGSDLALYPEIELEALWEVSLTKCRSSGPPWAFGSPRPCCWPACSAS